eukprot:2739918-Rhodomonas_salina.1
MSVAVRLSEEEDMATSVLISGLKHHTLVHHDTLAAYSSVLISDLDVLYPRYSTGVVLSYPSTIP